MKQAFTIGVGPCPDHDDDCDHKLVIALVLDASIVTHGDTEESAINTAKEILKSQMKDCIELWDTGLYDSFDIVLKHKFFLYKVSQSGWDWFKDNGKIIQLEVEIDGEPRLLSEIEKESK